MKRLFQKRVMLAKLDLYVFIIFIFCELEFVKFNNLDRMTHFNSILNADKIFKLLLMY